MDAEEALLWVVPAMLLLLAAGGLASYIEAGVYRLASSGNDFSGDMQRRMQLEQSYAGKRGEFARLRDEKVRLETEIAMETKERANLQDQPRRMADRPSNLVAEAGYPAPGTPGFYLKLEGPAAVMPFAGISSVATPLSGKRQVRLVAWVASEAEAQALALNWIGEDGKIVRIRPFSGKLNWKEV